MRLLILTQKVDTNDDVLSFFHSWIQEFAKQCDKITVVCLYEGAHDLPKNVSVHSLGKENGAGKIGRTGRFFKYIFKYKDDYDLVFVHMNPEYIVLGGWLWKLWGKKVFLWYMHKSVTTKLKIAEKFVERIFSGSKESFRLPTNKLIVTGHGIDTEYFTPNTEQKKRDKFALLSLGRLSKTKGHDLAMQATEQLTEQGAQVNLVVVGGPVTKEDEQYEQELLNLISKHHLEDSVLLAGGLPHAGIREYLWKSDLYVHLSNTGSVDKTVLEAMSCGVPVVSSSEAFSEMLAEASMQLLVKERSADALAKQVKELMWMPPSERQHIGERLRRIVERDHSLPKLIEDLVRRMKL